MRVEAPVLPSRKRKPEFKKREVGLIKPHYSFMGCHEGVTAKGVAYLSFKKFGAEDMAILNGYDRPCKATVHQFCTAVLPWFENEYLRKTGHLPSDRVFYERASVGFRRVNQDGTIDFTFGEEHPSQCEKLNKVIGLIETFWRDGGFVITLEKAVEIGKNAG